MRATRSPRGWLGDRRGVAAVEFALVVPIVLVVYLVGFEIAQAASVYRKLTDTTVQLANVTAQYTTMSQTDVANVMGASSQIMTPYSTGPLSIVLSEVTTDKNGAATVTWSQQQNGKALTCGSPVTLPAGFASASSNYILVQTGYGYTPTVGAGMVAAIPMSSQILMVPRQSPSIPYTGPQQCGP